MLIFNVANLNCWITNIKNIINKMIQLILTMSSTNIVASYMHWCSKSGHINPHPDQISSKVAKSSSELPASSLCLSSRFIKAQTFSIGFRSWETAGQGIIYIMVLKISHCCTCTVSWCIVLLQRETIAFYEGTTCAWRMSLMYVSGVSRLLIFIRGVFIQPNMPPQMLTLPYPLLVTWYIMFGSNL